jgi:two-component system sensor histidine kinase FlrB
VSKGDFQRRINEDGEDEVGRVAEAFNLMTESLQRTLDELAKKESLAAVGEFAASLAHEIRNPLTAVRVDLQKALAGLSSDSGLRSPLQRSLSEIERLNLTIDETLAQARIGRAGAESVDLRAVLEAGAEAAQPFFQERGASLILGAGEWPLTVRGDADALRQAFLNLFRNAAEALGPGGKAEVGVGVTEGTLEVTVTDTGTGIPEELQQRVFEPLFTTRTDGTGLGLAIVKRIVEAHGGTVALESESGRGTQIRVRLPML